MTLERLAPPSARFDPSGGPLSPDDFDHMLLAAVPHDTRDRLERVLDDAEALAARGLAAPAPPRSPWRAHLVRAWHHAADMEAFMAALGQPKPLAGVHDLSETAPARAIRDNLERRDERWVAAGLHVVSPWYERWVASLDGDDACIGYLNPHLAASFYWRGLRPDGPADASSAHMASDHHLGHAGAAVDELEHVVNAVIHQLPREHFGVHHRPLRSWDHLEEALRTDPILRLAPWIAERATLVAPTLASVERSGHATPWHRLRIEG